MGNRRAIKGGLVLHLHDLIPVLEEPLGTPPHDLVDGRRVLSPIRKPRPSRQFQGGLAGYSLREHVKESTEQLGVLLLETFPQLLFGSALIVRDALQLHHERPIQHVAPVGGDVDAVEEYRPPELHDHVLIVGVESAFGVSFPCDQPTEGIGGPLGDGVLAV
ncbi:MAG: hypothetical protein M3358_20460, partial [Actinomycetota bacterium]|nr:hypothetical protein [Actinomycetota bacterium]